MLRVSSNIASLSAQRALGLTQKNTERALKELATGSRFTSAGADAAGFAIAENMRSQIQGYKAARYNTDNATSFISLAENALQEQNNILVRFRELAVQSASDTFSDEERKMLDSEFQSLKEEFQRIAKNTKFGAQSLLDGSEKEYEFQVGIHKGPDNIIKYRSDADTTLAKFDLEDSDVKDKDDSRDSLELIDKALSKLNQERASLGSIQSRMEIAVSHIDGQVQYLTEAHSKIADANIAESVANVRKGQIMQQYQAAALDSSNDSQGYLLRLVA